MANFTLADDPHGHVPVMRDRMAELLAPAVELFGENAVLVDGTLGAGGHTEHFLSVFPQVRVIGVDRDPNALRQASERLAPFAERFVAVQARFDHVDEAIDNGQGPVFDSARKHGIAGALFDLGVSSMQLDQEERGFSYRGDAPLDMRMDQTAGITAAEVLNTYSHGDLARILKTYGDERFAGKIASAVVAEREREPFDRAARLVELLYAVENVVPVITDLLGVGGRAVFMSYQSLEDKIVKAAFADLTSSRTPAGLPMDLPGTEPAFRTVTRGAEKAPEAEIERNPRAAPVRVRCIEKLRPTT